MRHCLQLALKAEGRTSPNPIVGAVVLDKKGKLGLEAPMLGATLEEARRRAAHYARKILRKKE